MDAVADLPADAEPPEPVQPGTSAARNQVAGSSVSPGDSISASVAKSGSSYTLKVADSTHPANSFTTTQTCSDCAGRSAEWIAEAPSGSSGVYPLSDFRSWSASGASRTSGPPPGSSPASRTTSSP